MWQGLLNKSPVHTDNANDGGHNIDACGDTGVDQRHVAAVAHHLEELRGCTHEAHKAPQIQQAPVYL